MSNEFAITYKIHSHESIVIEKKIIYHRIVQAFWALHKLNITSGNGLQFSN